MKQLFLLLMTMAIVGCTSQTPFGSCIGVTSEKDPTLKYEIPTENVVMGIIFWETVVVPVVVVLNETYCPVGKK